MAKYLLRLKARELRKQGISVKDIAEILRISKSSASIWTRDIILSIEQIEALNKSRLQGAERGRLKSALLQKERWIKNMEANKKLGIKKIGKLSDREYLIAGLALYWGEGTRKNRRVEFCNSDPKMIQFLLIWLKRFFFIETKDIKCYISINQIHSGRENIVKHYWENVTNIPSSRFGKIGYKKIVNKKVYENLNDHYGTLAIRVLQPSRFYGKIMGLIEGLSTNANVAQG